MQCECTANIFADLTLVELYRRAIPSFSTHTLTPTLVTTGNIQYRCSLYFALQNMLATAEKRLKALSRTTHKKKTIRTKLNDFFFKLVPNAAATVPQFRNISIFFYLWLCSDNMDDRNTIIENCIYGRWHVKTECNYC